MNRKKIVASMPAAATHALFVRPIEALLLALDLRPLAAYSPPARTLNLLSCGGQYAIASWGQFSVEGAWVWRLKGRIDRRFFRRYSA